MSNRIPPYAMRGRGSAFRGAGRGRKYANRYTPFYGRATYRLLSRSQSTARTKPLTRNKNKTK